MAKQLCSVAVDWKVSGSMLILGILSLTGPSPREEAYAFVFCALVPLNRCLPYAQVGNHNCCLWPPIMGCGERERGRYLFSVISIRYTLKTYMNPIFTKMNHTKDVLHTLTFMSRVQTKALLHYVIK